MIFQVREMFFFSNRIHKNKESQFLWKVADPKTRLSVQAGAAEGAQVES